MKLTILGCGSSSGVPTVGCHCQVCSSPHPYNKRLRTAALITNENSKILIDSGPDFRQQALTHNISEVHGVIYTHAHADHINGIDDLTKLQSACEPNHCVKIYADEYTANTIKIRSPYLFGKLVNDGPWYKSLLSMHIIQHYQEFKISDTSILSFPQKHGSMTSLGLIFNNKIAYCTDVKELPESAYGLLENIEVLVIEALGHQETVAHAHLDLTLQWIDRIKPKQAILTHMGHSLEYEETTSYIKKQGISTPIVLGHDGLSVEV